MEVLPCSGVQYAGESDCPQRNSETTFVYQEEFNCPENSEHAKLVDGQPCDSLHNMQGIEIDKQGEGTHNVGDLLINSNCQVDDQKDYVGFHDFDEDMINERYLTSENSLSVVDTIESESPNNGREGDLSFSEPKWLEGDESVALWVKVTKCLLLLKFSCLLSVEHCFYKRVLFSLQCDCWLLITRS
jgi:hypothetical protein